MSEEKHAFLPDLGMKYLVNNLHLNRNCSGQMKHLLGLTKKLLLGFNHQSYPNVILNFI